MGSNLDEKFELIQQGAEGKLYRGLYLGRPVIVKERFNKQYRHPVLDEYLIKERMKAEARALLRCKIAGVHSPCVYLIDFERRCIFMEEIQNGTTVKDYINSITNLELTPETEKALTQLAREIGSCIGRLHREHIIHGDLTTSNMMVVRKDGGFERLYFIDFGLSHVAQTPEDKGVDLYVLERAILSTHPNSRKLFEDILASYMTTYKSGGKEVSKKFEEVRARGRKRTMVG